ncbi:LOW QUALITY PROTEIN: hypothetical protein PHMEG_00019861 [Phytophthora megakarya]|uniref:PiggyBac transposable element-derived protein domain-containing protein n=1 Tax=Phytophthora megakarya TaxID=4795 RepID=A0A225VQK1_9STRA|nr:LOW QUALITY PROTEIN: hypothetical protein PHMEG_00019861 [Phytophthora megakarya]
MKTSLRSDRSARKNVKSFVPPAELSFDEAMIPSRSSYNRTRMYMNDKPHNLGIGFCKAVVSKKKKRPKNIPRGTLTFARSKLVNNMTAVCWWHSKPVHFLSVGGNLALDRVERRKKTSDLKWYRAPRSSKTITSLWAELIFMISSRYSVQRAITYRKYYKSLFLGLVDLSITNGFIVHRAFCKKRKIKALTHVQYMCRLHIELIALPRATCSKQTRSSQTWTRYNKKDRLVVILVVKVIRLSRLMSGVTNLARERGCKVCAIHTEGKRGATTTCYCNDCDFAGPIYLCMKPKWSEDNTMMNCWEIWHTVYKNDRTFQPR